MSKNLKAFLFFSTFFGIGIGVVLPYVHDSKYLAAEKLEFEGFVEYIEWKTKNHALPLFIVKKQNGVTYRFNNGELNLSHGELKVGDKISKTLGSRYCIINSIKTECVNEFTSLYDLVFNAAKSGK
jgi:hypothetical protein